MLELELREYYPENVVSVNSLSRGRLTNGNNKGNMRREK
jgi:hypothetical protein